MTDHWLSDMLPRAAANGREQFEPIHLGDQVHGPADMPQKYPPYEPVDIDGDPYAHVAMAEKFKAGGIQVFNGGAAWPLDMDHTKIELEDIAHALSMKVRFTGHCTEDYKIAQHCCHVHDLVPEEDRLEGLLHDASEYVLPDVASPLKHAPQIRAWFKPIEDSVERAIARRFDLRFPYPPSVKWADNGMVLFERTKILKPAKHTWMVWTVPGEPAFIPDFSVWNQKRAKKEFLRRAEALGIV